MCPLQASDEARPKTRADSYLASFGLAYGRNGFLELVDEDQAAHGYIHHTLTPIAALGWNKAAPHIGRDRLKDVDFYYLIDRRFNMDGDGLELFSRLCGVEDYHGAGTVAFDSALRQFLRYRDLMPYFAVYPGAYHRAIRPRGFDYNDPDCPEIPGELAAWREAYAEEPEARQIMIATILCLYRGGIRDDEIWFEGGLPHRWNAPAALERLESSGYLADFGRLVTLCPGW